MTPDRLRRLAPIPLRMMLGFGFMIHGYPKLFTANGNQAFVDMLTNLGIPAPGLGSYLIGSLEFFGGIALLVGFQVVAVSALAAIEMLVAALMVHLPAGFNFLNITGMTDQGPQYGMPGYEVPLLYLAGFVSLILSGPGKVALTPTTAAPEPTAHTPAREREAVGVGDR